MSAPPGCGLLIFTDTLTAAVLIRINSAANYNVKVINASVKMCQTPRLHDGKAQQGKMKNKRFFLVFYVCLFHTAFLFLTAEKRQDALPNSRDHQLPGSLHLDGGSAHCLLPLLVFEVSVGLAAAGLPIILKTCLM